MVSRHKTPIGVVARGIPAWTTPHDGHQVTARAKTIALRRASHARAGRTFASSEAFGHPSVVVVRVFREGRVRTVSRRSTFKALVHLLLEPPASTARARKRWRTSTTRRSASSSRASRCRSSSARAATALCECPRATPLGARVAGTQLSRGRGIGAFFLALLSASRVGVLYPR